MLNTFDGRCLMNTVLFNVVSYIIEFLKLSLFSIFFADIYVKKRITIIFSISVLFLAFFSIYFNFSDYSIVFGLISIVLLYFSISEKKKIGQIILSYVFICILDMIVGAIFIFIFNISGSTVQSNSLFEIVINSFLFIPIGIAIIVKRKRYRDVSYTISTKYLLIFIVGGVSLALYITSIQFFGFEAGHYSSRKIEAFALSISSIIFIIICALLIFKQNQNGYLKKEANMNLKILKAQEEYYTMLLQREDQTKAFRHDIQNHIYCMNVLFENGKYEELGEYLSKIDKSLKELKPTFNTGNKLVDAIVSDIAIKHKNVCLKWIGVFPEQMSISAIDLCTVFSNLLMNAFEAAEQTDNKYVNVFVRVLESNLFISIANHTALEPKIINGEFISSKTNAGHGYGIRNIRKCLEKNNGSFEISFDDGVFTAEVIFSNVIPI